MDNRQIAELISERIGPRPVPFEAVRALALEIYHDLGGREDDENFADIFEILLSILPLTNLIDDTSIYLDKTWSSYKIDESFNQVITDVEELMNFDCSTIEPTTTNFVPGTEYTVHEALQRTANLFGGYKKEIDDINTSFNQVITGVEDLMNFDCSTIEPTTTNFVPGTEYTVHEALQRTANLFGGYQDEIDNINALIPGQATTQNQLADKAFVNSTVATNAANFRGNWSKWRDVPTDASMYPKDYVGSSTPTNNDYMVIQEASDYVSPESLAHKLTVVNLHATKSVTIGITDEYGLYREYYYNDGFLNTWKIISIEYSLKYIGGKPGSWCIKTNKPEDTHIIKGGVSYSNANDGILLVKTNDSTVPVIIGIQPQFGQYQGSWRFIYVGDWTTNGILGWKPQYKVGSTFTAVQQAAIDSGITAVDVSTYNSYGTSITALQTDKLDKVYTGLKIYGTNTLGEQISYEAGTGISFENGKISNTNTEVSWGNITGTISDQTDLSTALDSKQDVLTAGNNITINGTTISANDTTYSASDNIDITNNAIKAVGYSYDTTNGAFAEGDRDIVEGSITWIKSTATGLMSHAEGTGTVASGTASHAEGSYTTASGDYSHAEGLGTNASGGRSHAEGYNTNASGYASHAEGETTTASGTASHAEGWYVKAVGNYSHAEGYDTNASGDYSHAEGYDTNASGGRSHAEGERTTASSTASHAEGYLTIASGNYSHVEGYYTEAKNLNEHASCMYNKSNNLDANAQTIFSIGIGTSDTDRKNAIEVLRDGRVFIKGIGGYDGTNPFNSSSLQDFLSSLNGGGNA